MVAFAVAVAIMQTISIPLLPALPRSSTPASPPHRGWPRRTLIVGAAVNPIIGRMGDVYGKRRLLLVCLARGRRDGRAGHGRLAAGRHRRASRPGSRSGYPAAYGIIRDELSPPASARGVAMVTAAGAGIGAGLEPVVMGTVVERLRLAGGVLVTGGLRAALVLVLIDQRRGADLAGPLRRPRCGGAGAGLVVLLLAITNGSRWGWTSAPWSLSSSRPAGWLVWWLRWERSQDDPIVDLDLNGQGPVLLPTSAG